MHCAALLFTRRVIGEPPTLESVFDQITAPKFPARVDELTIWARLFYSSSEVGPHDLQLLIWDQEERREIGSSLGTLNLPERPERPHPSNDLTINLANADLPHRGEYEFRLIVDGSLIGAVWLTVN